MNKPIYAWFVIGTCETEYLINMDRNEFNWVRLATNQINNLADALITKSFIRFHFFLINNLFGSQIWITKTNTLSLDLDYQIHFLHKWISFAYKMT